MKSHEVLKQATEELGVKAVAAALKVSPALVYKWCEPPGDPDGPELSGAKNPLDRVLDLYRLTDEMGLINWLCNQAGGSFVKNPAADPRHPADQNVFAEGHGMLRDFTELLGEVTKAYDDDKSIDPKEASRIRSKWEDLKAVVERFVRSCEGGYYYKKG